MERADSPPRTALKLRNTQERTLFWLVPKKQAIPIIVLVRSCRYPAATREVSRSNPLWPATSFDRRAPCPPAKVAAGYRSQRRWRSAPRNPVSGPVETAHSLAERGVCGRRHSFVDGKDVPQSKRLITSLPRTKKRSSSGSVPMPIPCYWQRCPRSDQVDDVAHTINSGSSSLAARHPAFQSSQLASCTPSAP